MKTVLMILLGIVSIAIIAAWTVMEDRGNGAAALGGGNSAVAKKQKSRDILLNKISMYGAIAFAVLVLVLIVVE